MHPVARKPSLSKRLCAAVCEYSIKAFHRGNTFDSRSRPPGLEHSSAYPAPSSQGRWPPVDLISESHSYWGPYRKLTRSTGGRPFFGVIDRRENRLEHAVFGKVALNKVTFGNAVSSPEYRRRLIRPCSPINRLATWRPTARRRNPDQNRSLPRFEQPVLFLNLEQLVRLARDR